jgi:anti-sigma factor RsiW
MSKSDNTSRSDAAEDSEDPRLTELVAYLDGELDESNSERLEKRLAQDRDLRQYAETLDRTWQMLNTLGEPTASGEFTRKTLASITAISAESESVTASQQGLAGKFFSIPFGRILLWLLVGFGATSAALLLARQSDLRRTSAEDQQLLRDLELLKEYQRLRPLPDVDFLKELSTQKAEEKQP